MAKPLLRLKHDLTIAGLYDIVKLIHDLIGGFAIIKRLEPKKLLLVTWMGQLTASNTPLQISRDPLPNMQYCESQSAETHNHREIQWAYQSISPTEKCNPTNPSTLSGIVSPYLPSSLQQDQLYHLNRPIKYRYSSIHPTGLYQKSVRKLQFVSGYSQ